MLKKLFQNEHFQSFFHTFVTDLLWEVTVAAAAAHIFFDQDYSKTAFLALGYAIFRTLIKALREYFQKPNLPPTPEQLQDMNP